VPFLTVLAPSERYHQERKQRHKQLTEWARQMISQVRHWLPNRVLVVVADSSYAALHLLAATARLPQPVTMITRLRLSAALYQPAPLARQGHAARHAKRPGTLWVPAELGRGAQRSGERLGADHHPLVWRSESPSACGLGDSGLVSHRVAARPTPLGADKRSGGQIRTPGLAEYGSEAVGASEGGMVRVALATGSDL
jgi:DDE superfamily endonuclease